MKPTIYTITYNEQLMLPFFIEHYRMRFPGCHIVIYDNESTDDTVKIAKAAGCEVRLNLSGGRIINRQYLQIKNTCWCEAETDWVLVCDCDELLDITAAALAEESNKGVSAIRAKAYNMVNLNNDLNLKGITYGVRSESYDKLYLFKRTAITDINYAPGAHTCSPKGRVQYSKLAYILRHYKYINPDYMVARHAEFAKRLSDEDNSRGYGGHYHYGETRIREEFEAARLNAVNIEQWY